MIARPLEKVGLGRSNWDPSRDRGIVSSIECMRADALTHERAQMNRTAHKRHLAWLAFLMLASCAEDKTRSDATYCGPGEIRSGSECISPNGDSNGGGAVSSTPTTQTDTMNAGPTSLPFGVDDFWFASGYMGDGELGAIETNECETRLPDAVGACHHFTWAPVSADENGKGWAGVLWQYPSNNWGDIDEKTGMATPGLEVPSGAQSIRFHAWSDAANTVVSFGAGILEADGFSVTISEIALTNEPVEYILDLRNANVTRSSAHSAGPPMRSVVPTSTSMISSIRTSHLREPHRPRAPTGHPLNFPLQSTISGRPQDTWEMEKLEASHRHPVRRAENAAGACHRFDWTPVSEDEGGKGWAGVYWQYPRQLGGGQ